MIMTRENQSTRRIPFPLPLCPPQIPYEMIWHWTRILAARGRQLTAWAIARPCAEFRRTPLCQSIKIPYESTHSCYTTDVTRFIPHLDKQQTTGALKDRIHNLLSNFICIANRWLHGIQTNSVVIWLIKVQRISNASSFLLILSRGKVIYDVYLQRGLYLCEVHFFGKLVPVTVRSKA